MSFRSRREKRESKDTDMKVSHAKDDKSKDDKGTDKPAAEQSEQSGQSGQPPQQNDEQSDEQDSEDEEDKSGDQQPVPDGTTAEILKWVGDDPERAQRALDKEQADDRPRTGLTGELNRILEQ